MRLHATAIVVLTADLLRPIINVMYKEHPSEKMLACQYMGPKNMQINPVPKPMITAPKDAIVRVTHCTICGSDLHMCKFQISVADVYFELLILS